MLQPFAPFPLCAGGLKHAALHPGNATHAAQHSSFVSTSATLRLEPFKPDPAIQVQFAGGAGGAGDGGGGFGCGVGGEGEGEGGGGGGARSSGDVIVKRRDACGPSLEDTQRVGKLVLVGTGWYWLELVGTGWYWLVLVGTGWCWVGTGW